MCNCNGWKMIVLGICKHLSLNCKSRVWRHFIIKARLNLKPDQNIKTLILTLWYPLGIQELSHRCFRVIFSFLPYKRSDLKWPLKIWDSVTIATRTVSFQFRQFAAISKSGNQSKTSPRTQGNYITPLWWPIDAIAIF